MNHPLPSFPAPAIKQLLLNWLQAALDLYCCDAALANEQSRKVRLPLASPHLALYRIKDCSRIAYVSWVALQLSQEKKIPALEIAQALATLLSHVGLRQGIDLEQDITVLVAPPGSLHLELSEHKLAAWLQHLIQVSGRAGERESGRVIYSQIYPSSCLFSAQYAHARCCSLIKLAHREGLLTLKQPDANSGSWVVVSPNPIPWLKPNQKLCLTNLAEQTLIAQLVDSLDNLYCPGRENKVIDWEKVALNLSQAFQNFYSSSRIWGEVRIQTPKLAQARLGLILATQSVLRLLLQDFLGVIAPLEL